MRRMSFNSESGAILPIVIIFMLALTITGIAFLNAGVMENSLVRKRIANSRAFYLADAGIEHLWVKLSVLEGHQKIKKIALEGGGTDGPYRPAVGGTALTRLALGEGGYWVEYYDEAAPYAISIGQVIKDGNIYDIPGDTPDLGNVIVEGETIAQRKIRIGLLEGPLFDYLIFGKEWVTIGGNSTIDFIEGAEKGQVGTNGDTYGDFTVGGNAQVIANVYIVGEADEIIDGIDGIEGDVSVGPPIEWPAVTPPDGLPDPEPPLDLGPTDAISIVGNHQYPSITIKGTLTIPAGVRCILLADTVEISAGGEIIIEDDSDPPAHLEIYVREEARLGGHGITNVGRDPSQCQIYGIGESTIRYEGTSDFYGSMYAPEGNIRCRGDAKIQGSLIGNTVDVNGNPLVSWDPAVGTGGPTKTSLINWEEIFR